MKTTIAMTEKTQELILEILPAVQVIFYLGFIPEPDEIVELSPLEYRELAGQIEAERPLFTVVPKNPKYHVNGIHALNRDEVRKMKLGIEFLAKYAHDRKLPFQDSDKVLQAAAREFPNELSQGTKFEQAELKLVQRQEATQTKRESWMDFLNSYLDEGDYLNVKVKDENGVERDEYVAPSVEKTDGPKMSYKEFKAHALDYIASQFSSEEYEVTEGITRTTDENAYEVIRVRSKSENIEVHRGIRVSAYFRDYALGKTLDEVLANMEKAAHESGETAKEINSDINVGQLHLFEEVKDKLMVRPLNYKKNQELLKNYAYRRYNDIALVIYALMKNDSSGISTTKINKSIIDKWEISDDELFDLAIANTERLFKACIMPMSALMRGKTPDTYEPKHKYLMDSNFVLEKDAGGVYSLSLEGNVNAATAVFYKGTLKKLAKELKDDLYLVISSMSFVMAHAKRSIPLNQVRRMAQQEKNNPYANPDEFLSDGVYFYNRKEDSLRMMYQ